MVLCGDQADFPDGHDKAAGDAKQSHFYFIQE